MTRKIGVVEALMRYPVKSMRGDRVWSVAVGWHGLEGDRRLAFRRLEGGGGFPWLTASRLPELVRFTPLWQGPEADRGMPTHIRTPEGKELDVFGPELAAEVGRRYGASVAMMHLDRGIFDEAAISLITTSTVNEVGRLSGHRADARRFRPNVLIATEAAVPFGEEAWVGGVLSFGDGGPLVAITNRDERCAMVNIDPDSADRAPEVMKAIVQARNNQAGVYGAVLRRGRIEVGQPVVFEPIPEHRRCGA